MINNYDMYCHTGLTSNSIPETPGPRAASKASPFSPSLSQDNTFKLNGSAVNPITLGDSDEDSEPEMVPLRKRIGVEPSTASITTSRAASSKSSLTPSQAAGAAALRRLNAVENRRKCASGPPPLVDLDGDQSTKGKESASVSQRAKQPAGRRNDTTVRELLDQTPSNFAGTSSSSVRPQTSHQSISGEQSVDLSCPEFILRPGMGTI